MVARQTATNNYITLLSLFQTSSVKLPIIITVIVFVGRYIYMSYHTSLTLVESSGKLRTFKEGNSKCCLQLIIMFLMEKQIVFSMETGHLFY